MTRGCGQSGRLVLAFWHAAGHRRSFVNRSPRGYFALHVQVQDALHQLTQQRRVTRQMVSGLYLYTATDRAIQRGQLVTRCTVEVVPTVADASAPEVSEEELKASILLFYSLLDEQQRRLYAGLESLKLGGGGDRQLADFLGLDSHTVARGRQQLLVSWTWRWTAPAGSAGANRWKKTPEIIQAIEIRLEHDTAGDPITGLKWTRAAYIIDTSGKQPREHAVKFQDVARSITTGVFLGLVGGRHTAFALLRDQPKATGEKRYLKRTPTPRSSQINSLDRSYRVFGEPQWVRYIEPRKW
jgi:hypothetical protein